MRLIVSDQRCRPEAVSAMPLTPHSPSTAGPHSGAARRDPTPWQMAAVPGSVDLAAAEAFCREVARRHYENFTVATRLVPRRLRQHLANVYAYARWSDDLAAEAASPVAQVDRFAHPARCARRRDAATARAACCRDIHLDGGSAARIPNAARS